MERLSSLKLALLSVLAVFALSGGGLATIAAWQDDLTVGNVTVASGDGWGKPAEPIEFTQIAVGGGYTVAIDVDGNAWGWGANNLGQLGDGTTVNRNTPVKVSGGHQFKQISAGTNHMVALDANGDAWTWGYNRYGQLGNGTSGSATNSNTPVKVSGGHKFKQIMAGTYHTVALDTNGDAWAWGYNRSGELGNGKSGSSTKNDSNTPTQVAGGRKFKQIATNSHNTIAIDTDGAAWSWGDNRYGQLGDGTSGTENSRNTPVKVSGGHKFKQISNGFIHTVAIDTNGDAWAWGSNGNGQFGNGTTTRSNIPIKVTEGYNFTQISAGHNYTVAIDKNDDAWAWGNNSNGQLGDGTTTSSPTPIRVAKGHKFTQISAGNGYTIALDTNRHAWAWGRNKNGQLGNGTTDNSPVPVEVMSR